MFGFTLRVCLANKTAWRSMQVADTSQLAEDAPWDTQLGTFALETSRVSASTNFPFSVFGIVI